MRTVLIRILIGLAAASPAACAAAPALPAAGSTVWVEREAFVMGTRLRLSVSSGSREAGLAATERALSEVRRLDAVLSSWTPASEVGVFNRVPPGTPAAISAELRDLMEEALLWRDRTGGAFDPAVGALVDAWDLRGEGRRPSRDALDSALRASGREAVSLDASGSVLSRASEAVWLDTGGFGKGVALRAAAAALRSSGVEAALLDFGGQVLALGDGERGAEGWEVPVAHPSRRDVPVASLRLRDASAATTAQSERFVEVEGEKYGHVLDPRSGWPVRPWGSVTVVAADPLVADVLSTALFVLGPVDGMHLAHELEDGIGVLFLEDRGGDLVASWNTDFERYRIRTSY